MTQSLGIAWELMKTQGMERQKPRRGGNKQHKPKTKTRPGVFSGDWRLEQVESHGERAETWQTDAHTHMNHHKNPERIDIHICKCLTSLFDPPKWMSEGENECPETKWMSDSQYPGDILEGDIHLHFRHHCQTFINLYLIVWHSFLKMSMTDIHKCWTLSWRAFIFSSGT